MVHGMRESHASGVLGKQRRRFDRSRRDMSIPANILCMVGCLPP